MQKDMITIRNQKLGESVCQKLQSRGFEAYYCPDKATALRQALALMNK